MAEIKQFTIAEVQQHNNSGDLWLIIHDKVYDVTKFLHEHPGGEEVLEEKAGKDATKDFDEVGHSDSAIEQLANYYLGDIIDADRKEKKVIAKDQPSGNSGARQPNKKLILVGISVACIAIGAILMFKGIKSARAH